MKNLIALLAIFLLIGCQTTDELSKEEPPKKEVKSANVEPPKPVLPNLFNSKKPILCGKVQLILDRIMSKAKERPVIFWESEPFGYPAALYINRETGTSTVLDFLSREQVCMVAAGKNLRLSKEFIPTEGKTIRYLTKSD
jgi:hypothetical protein